MKSPPVTSAAVAAAVAAFAAAMGACDAFVVRPAAPSVRRDMASTEGPARRPGPPSVDPFPSPAPFVDARGARSGRGGGVGPLRAIVDVPPGFFTTMFIALGLTNTLIRKVQREALEEQAWRLRIEESREARMAEDPTLTELDLIREEADARPRPYGPEARERREREGRRGGVRILTIEDGPDAPPRRSSRRETVGGGGAYEPMTDEEIDDFEVVYGVSYDPYYDEPYEEDELPTDVKYRVDRLYGDRRYENGEVFYRDESTGLYWRQGCKPRVKKMWGIS